MEKNFIVCAEYFEDEGNAPTVLFRRDFYFNGIGDVKLSLCPLGIGYAYLNGKRVSNDLFIAPVSDYRKTLWVNEYDVTALIKKGENELLVEVGNGFYNEGIETVWGHHKAEWRGVPTLWAKLTIDGKEVFSTDQTWQTAVNKTIYFNQIRSGEYFDSRRKVDLSWNFATINGAQPKGEFRKCECEPIREMERIRPVSVYKSEKGWIFDFGKNISGYAEIDALIADGQEVILIYSEDIDEYGELKFNGLNIYQKAPFQVDKVIGNGEHIVWKPQFAYHGFRYVEIIGLKNEPTMSLLTAIFIQQSVETLANFECSDETLNKIYQAGIASTKSNMFYSLTDCPTREKLGWTNDAQASLEQFLFNFDGKKLLKKWLVDICDSMNAEGDLSGIAPSPDWGYGHGPVCNGIIFMLPYLLYKYCGDKEPLITALPYMKRYNTYLLENLDSFHLGDWTGVDFMPTPKMFITQAYLFMFAGIFNAIGEDYATQYLQAQKALEQYIKDGQCIVEAQSAGACLIVIGIGDRNRLGEQLASLIAQADGHIACGMFGIQFLYKALLKTGQADLAYSMIMNKTAPSFRNWIDIGATTLWETFDENAGSISKNHHMFSNVLYFFIEGLCGLKRIGENEYLLMPHFVQALSSVKCNRKTKEGSLSVSWKRITQGVQLTVCTTGKVSVTYHGKQISGEEIFIVSQADGK